MHASKRVAGARSPRPLPVDCKARGVPRQIFAKMLYLFQAERCELVVLRDVHFTQNFLSMHRDPQLALDQLFKMANAAYGAHDVD